MNIIPISSMAILPNSPLGNLASMPKSGNAIPFESIFKEALINIEETANAKTADSYNLAVGEVDNIAEMMINSEKADLAVQTMVQLRNRVLDAYSEVMRLNI